MGYCSFYTTYSASANLALVDPKTGMTPLQWAASQGLDEVAVEVPHYVSELFITSEHGPALMYELAKNTKELERISKLSPIQAALEIGKLEAKITSSSKSAAPSVEKKATKAPAPIDPVGGKGGSVKKSLSDPNLSQAEYEKLRREQMKAASA